jgi:choline-phosphate cytidylyltransferase
MSEIGGGLGGGLVEERAEEPREEVAEVAAMAASSPNPRDDPRARMPRMSRTVITFGTFDVFHVGHLRVLERAAELGDRLVVGVSADALNERKKGRAPIFSERERLAIVGALKVVDAVFVEESLEQKRDYILEHGADVLVMGDDWACEVVYLARTPAISTTAIIEHIADL